MAATRASSVEELEGVVGIIAAGFARTSPGEWRELCLDS
jgi:hypothetical protein